MIVVCFCGLEYHGDTSIVCLNQRCSEFGKVVREDAQEPTVEEALMAFEFAHLAAGWPND